RGWTAYKTSRYMAAEAAFRSALGVDAPKAREGLATTLLETGRYVDAAAVAADAAGAPEAVALALVRLRGEALRRQGKLDEAERVLASAAGAPEAREVRLLLGQVLLEQGRRDEAEPVLMTLIEQYNHDAIDAQALPLVGRAAYLLRSPADANDAFNEAERAGPASAETLLWRAEVFLENYDPGHAEEVVAEVLGTAPHNPEALAWMAEVKLASNLDFDAAEKLAREALAQNPNLAHAHFVLGGIALRDMDLDGAERHIADGLRVNPRDLDLLSLHAAVRFLADDKAGFESAKNDVLSKNSRYSRLYQIIGEYAEWEHRYRDLVVMMREALLADPEDAKVRAQLGFNLIRAGEEADGVAALQRAFAADPFNVRVYNTLNLYEKEIPAHYVTVPHGRFTIRYHDDERAILDRYVPALLEQAWAKMVKEYDFTPTTPVGIELYPNREHFAVRTSGLPQTFIQGVCFGQTLAAMSPKVEHFNIGMTLWHELAHIFHIQLSKNRVPRWFTEGLAEYETLIERPEWRREYDAALFAALAAGKIEPLAEMNREFSHAEDMDDMATAYYASTQVVAFIADNYGMPKVRRMLELWGEGKRTPDVIREALGVEPDDVDRKFRAALDVRLSRYKGQFIPPTRPVDLDQQKEKVRRAPGDPEELSRLALAYMGVGDEKGTTDAIDRALAIDPKHALALWLRVQFKKTRNDRPGAYEALNALLAAGHDGYGVRMALADVAPSAAERIAALDAARKLDPTESSPLRALIEIYAALKDEDRQIELLRSLVLLEENDGDAYDRLLELLIARKGFDEAKRVGQAAVYVDIESPKTHRLYAEALAGAGDAKGARFELESAVLCAGEPAELALAQRELADVLEKAGDRAGASAHRKAAIDLASQPQDAPGSN
ncbi:MAG TPA: tetratricopeptide repeat protein, partial [Polyangiaceae bacterium]|nr:tetratricopeptide repeat protein [Polyangiaceae bacterium]